MWLALPEPSITLVQSLPGPLDHYAHALSDVFVELGFRVGLDTTLDVQTPGRRLPRVVIAYLVRALRRRGDLTVVLWPSFGLLEPLLWLRRRSEVLVIIHDATPLRRQRGYGRIAARLGAIAVRLGVQVVTHSPASSEELARRNWAAIPVVPLPIDRSHDGGPEASRSGVRVLGQYKPSRDLEAMAQIAGIDSGEPLEVIGRGWPHVEGWEVRDQFVDEDVFAGLIATSRAIVIPYGRVWQSDVAVRALESLTPVTCLATPGIRLTWGDSWPGYVGDDGWVAALQRALQVPPGELAERRADAYRRCLQAWQMWFKTREHVTSQSAAPPPTS